MMPGRPGSQPQPYIAASAQAQQPRPASVAASPQRSRQQQHPHEGTPRRLASAAAARQPEHARGRASPQAVRRPVSGAGAAGAARGQTVPSGSGATSAANSFTGAVGGGLAAVRAAGRSGGASEATAPAAAWSERGSPAAHHAGRRGGSELAAAATAGTAAAAPPPSPPACSGGGGSGDTGHRGTIRSSNGPGGPGKRPAGAGALAGGKAVTGGPGGTAPVPGGGDEVSRLPLQQQVVHYTRSAASAAAAADPMRAAMALHLLNGCLMQAPGFEAGGELAAAAAAAAPGLLACLVEQVAEGAPFSIVALNTLSYLVLSPQVLPGVLACGLLPVLVGQLRAAASAPLEQQLLVAGLGLLATMARVDGGARARLAATRGLAGALAAALGSGSAAVKWPALQLLQEIVIVKVGLQQVLASAPLRAAIDKLCDQPAVTTPRVTVPAGSGEEQVGGASGGGDSGSGAAGAEGHATPGNWGAGLPAAAGVARPDGGVQAEPQPDALAREARSMRRTLAALATVMGVL